MNTEIYLELLEKEVVSLRQQLQIEKIKVRRYEETTQKKRSGRPQGAVLARGVEKIDKETKEPDLDLSGSEVDEGREAYE